MADASASPAPSAPSAPSASSTPGENAEVKPAQFPDLAGAGNVPGAKPDLDLVKDIAVTLTVELGRTEMLIADIIELAAGKVIELDRLNGEPLDILVNGKLLAKGEVVVVDDNFGIRITAIVDGRKRQEALAAATT